LTAWLSFEGHCNRDFTKTLLHTTTTFGAALTPTSPSFQLAIDGARLKITLLDGCQGQALCTSIGMHKHITGQVLFAFWSV
jgi:hypothetical protein